VAPDHEESTWDAIQHPTATVVNPAARMMRGGIKTAAIAASHTTTNWGAASQASARPVSRGRYCWIAPRNEGTTTSDASRENRIVKIPRPKIRTFLAVRNRKFKSGFG